MIQLVTNTASAHLSIAGIFIIIGTSTIGRISRRCSPAFASMPSERALAGAVGRVAVAAAQQQGAQPLLLLLCTLGTRGGSLVGAFPAA